MIHATLFTRKDCHLCDEVLNELAALQKQYPHELLVIDVDGSEVIKERYGLEIPVVEIGSITLKAPITQQELAIAFEQAQEQESVRADAMAKQVSTHSTGSNQMQETWTKADSFANWIYKHYLALFNLVIVLYLGLPFLAPVLMQSGMTTPARLIYKGYGLMCHQLAYRSVFLFGEQMFYPRISAGVNGISTYGEVSGLTEGDSAAERFEARDYLGEEGVGYKIALCQRDVGIYGGILVFGLLFGITGKRIPALPWYLWIIIGILPIAVDGVSQLISQPPLAFLPYRESTPILRSITGFLFGFSTAWFGYPLIEQSMKEGRDVLKLKRRRIDKRGKSDL